MAKNKKQKQEIITLLKDKIERAKSIIFTKFDCLAVGDNNELRKQLKAQGGEYYVAKKTLLDMALQDKKVDGLDIRKFDGRVATVFAYDDEVAPAKIVDDFKKKLEDQIDFLGGIIDNKFLNADEINKLAKLPSKQELRARIVGSINAPVSGFVNALAGNLRNMVYVLKAIENKK